MSAIGLSHSRTDGVAGDDRVQLEVLQPILLRSLGYNVDPTKVARAIEPDAYNVFGQRIMYARNEWIRLVEVVEDGHDHVATFVLLFAEKIGLVVAHDVPDATAWSWSADGAVNPFGRAPLLAPHRRNWPRKPATILALVKKGLHYILGRGGIFQPDLRTHLGAIQGTFPDEARLTTVLARRHAETDGKDNRATTLAMRLMVSACDPCHAFRSRFGSRQAEPCSHHVVEGRASAKGLYHAATASAVIHALQDAALL